MRMVKILVSVAGALPILGLWSGLTLAASLPPVSIADGKIQAAAADGGVVHYWGIPFAAPPVGDLRWRAPQPPKPWTGTLLADQFGHDCMQNARAGPPVAASRADAKRRLPLPQYLGAGAPLPGSR